MSQPFSTSWRVRFDEIDLQGVVHHSQIVTYLEIARLEYWRSMGLSYGKLREDGFEFIVHELKVTYIKPLNFDEIVTAKVTVKDLKRASFVMAYEIYKENGKLGVTAEIELVCAKNNIAQPVALPAEYREKLS